MPLGRKKILYLITSSAWGGAERYVAKVAAEASKTYDVAVMAGGSENLPLLKQEGAGGVIRAGITPLAVGSDSITPPPFGHLPLHQGEGTLRGALPGSVRFLTLPELVQPIAPVSDARAIMKLMKFLDAEEIDIVHCNSSKAGMVGALAAAFSKRKPKVAYTAHGWGFLERRSFLFRAAIFLSELLAARFRAATIVLSEKERAVAARFGLSSPERLHLIPHGIDASEISFLPRDEARRELLGQGSDSFIIGTIANAYKAKALPLLIAAFGRAAGARKDAKLVIIGDGPEMRSVKAAREASPFPERILLMGAVKDASRLLKGFDVFVLSSIKEGMPWVILEASLAGVPIVATRVGAIPEMLMGGQGGILIVPGDQNAMTDVMVKLMTDSAACEELRSVAPLAASARTAGAMIEKTLELYGRLSDTHSRRKILWDIASVVAVFALATAWQLMTFIPTVWHPDSLNFIGGGMGWADGGFSIPVHDLLTYVGWVGSIALMYSSSSAPFDPLQAILNAKLLGIFFIGVAAVGQYLLAKRLFASWVFALLATALFATNPYVWLSGNGALSDLPALSVTIIAFLFFIRFFQNRKMTDLVTASFITGVAIVFRIQSIIILAPFLAGILWIAFEAPRQEFLSRLKMILKLGLISIAFPSVFFLVVFGMPWEITSGTPLSAPSIGYLFSIIKWYVARDIGWIWFLLSWTGIAVGLYRKQTRPFAVMLVVSIVAGATYFIPSHLWTAPETSRYLISTIPFTMLGIGFLWTAGLKWPTRAGIFFVAVAYVTSIFIGLRSPQPTAAEKPGVAMKLLFLQYYLAKNANDIYAQHLPMMMNGIVAASALPDDSAIIMPESRLMEARFMFREKSREVIRVVRIKPNVPESERYLDLASSAKDRFVFVYVELIDTPVAAILKSQGYVPRGKVGETVLFTK